MSTADELERLSRLRDDGVLTDDEFEVQKAALLSRSAIGALSPEPSNGLGSGGTSGRPWYRNPRYGVPGVLVLAVAIAIVAVTATGGKPSHHPLASGNAGASLATTSTNPTTSATLAPTTTSTTAMPTTTTTPPTTIPIAPPSTTPALAAETISSDGQTATGPIQVQITECDAHGGTFDGLYTALDALNTTSGLLDTYFDVGYYSDGTQIATGNIAENLPVGTQVRVEIDDATTSLSVDSVTCRILTVEPHSP